VLRRRGCGVRLVWASADSWVFQWRGRGRYIWLALLMTARRQARTKLHPAFATVCQQLQRVHGCQCKDQNSCNDNDHYVVNFCRAQAYPVSQINCWPILIISGNIAAKKIFKQMVYCLLIISSLCMIITEQKNKRYSVCFQCCRLLLPSCQFSAAFQKFVQPLQYPTFI